MLVKFSDALLSREQMKGVKGGCMYYDSQGGCADNFGTQYGTSPSPLSPENPLPPRRPMCWQNVLTGELAKNPNLAESGWIPTDKTGCL